MTTIEEMEKIYKRYRAKFFEKYFIDKNISDAILNTSQEIIMNLLIIYTKISMFIECLSVLRSDKKFFNKLDMETKLLTKETIVGLKIMRKDLDNILEPIGKGLSEEM